MQTPESITRHFADHVAHQQTVWDAALTAEGYDVAIIHAGSQIISFMDDYHYPFRPNPHFLSWLPLTRHDESVLIVRPGQKPVLYFYQPEDYWYLPPSDPEAWWADHFEIIPVREPGAWRVGVPVGVEAYIGDAPDLAGENSLNPKGVINRVHLGRTRKSEYEIACMREAARIGVIGHQAAEKAFREGGSEFEIHQRYLQATQSSDAELPYGSIVALNEHGAVLHYQMHEKTKPDAYRSFLIDAGVTVNAYCSDITRTYATDGGEFTDLIAAMDEMQLGLCSEMRAGVDYRDLHLETHLRISGILNDFDIIKSSPEAAVESGLSSVFYPHGLGHFIGLQTHDVGGLIDNRSQPSPPPDGHPFLRLTRVLEPGNVLTVEPGLYFIDLLLEKARANGHWSAINWDKVGELKPYGGVRIEDDVVVTSGDPINLTREAYASF